MSREYDLYLEDHKANVRKGFEWLRENLPDVIDACNFGIEHQVCYAHDESKNERDEYEAYDAYFYGGNQSYQVVQDFNYAWLKHIHRNPHHWQHWILNHDDEGEEILDMPYNDIVEMICDWLSFSFSKGDLKEIFKWYDEHKSGMKLSDKTRNTVDDILRKISQTLMAIGYMDTNGKKIMSEEK